MRLADFGVKILNPNRVYLIRQGGNDHHATRDQRCLHFAQGRIADWTLHYRAYRAAPPRPMRHPVKVDAPVTKYRGGYRQNGYPGRPPEKLDEPVMPLKRGYWWSCRG